MFFVTPLNIGFTAIRVKFETLADEHAAEMFAELNQAGYALGRIR
jgi:hypothetical protein